MWFWTLVAAAASGLFVHFVYKRDRRALVFVLGDLGRSPRMQLHAKSLADAGFQVDFVGYAGTQVPEFLEKDAKVRLIHLSPARKLSANAPRWMYVILAALRTLWQFCQVFLVLFSLPSPSYILCQTPPAVPTLLVVQLLSRCRHSKLLIDWHNFGYSIMALNLGKDSKVVRGAELYERLAGKYAYAHICVSDAMCKFLKEEWKLDGIMTVLHDKAPVHFQSLSTSQRSKFLSKMNIGAEEVAFSGPGGSQSSEAENGICEYNYLLVSSTSWTEDEDFSILLDALVKFDVEMRKKTKSQVKILVIITGKGSLKEFYLGDIAKLSLVYVNIKTAWLTAEDYPLLLGSADLGISLHTSSSGLDLPMKIVDMFGCGLPVCAAGYTCLAELVQHGVNGLTFSTSDELYGHLCLLLQKDDRRELDKLQAGTRTFQKERWSDNWDARLKPLLLTNA